jgi:hypothetical protein
MTMTRNGERTSNRIHNLVRLHPKDWAATSREDSLNRGWYPNRPYVHRHTRDMVINSQRSGEGKHWAISYKAIYDLVNAELERKIDQAQVRLTECDGKYVASQTVQNVWRRLEHAPVNKGSYGEYWWVDEHFNAQDPSNPNDQLIPF